MCVPGATIFCSSELGSRVGPVMAYSLPMVGAAALASMYTGGRAEAGENMGEYTSATGPGRRSSVNITGADYIYGSGDFFLEDHGIMLAILVKAVLCYNNLMTFSSI